MRRKEIDGKTVINRRQYSVSHVFGLTLCGCVSLALGIFLLKMEIEILTEVIRGEKPFGGQYIFMTLVVLIFLGVGIGALVWGWKDVYHWKMKRIAKELGEDSFAVIVKSSWHSRESDTSVDLYKRYGFVLSYKKDGEVKTFKTDEVYDVNEFEYLSSLEKIKIKIYKNYVVINEEFRYEIYKKDSMYGYDMKYYTEKPYSTIYKIFSIATPISVVAFFVLSALTIILHNNLFIFTGIGLIFLASFPFLAAWYYLMYNDKRNKL